MPVSRPPEGGTLVIATLLLMALTFAGYWITSYVDPDSSGRPWTLVWWFLLGAAGVLSVAFVLYLRRGRS